MRQIGLHIKGTNVAELRASLQAAMEEIRRVLRDLDGVCDNLDGEISRVRRNNTLVIPTGSGESIDLTVYNQVVQPPVPPGPGIWHKPGSPSVSSFSETTGDGLRRYWNQFSKGRPT